VVKGSSAPMLVQRCFEWSDTDASGAWHNAAALRLVEAAEVALLDALGLLGRFYGRMPRAHITIEFKRSLRFRDLVASIWR
jgi:acyl-CoA thioester hydrolase